MKFAADISMLWSELPFLDRFDAAAAAGFEAVEVPSPYDISVREIHSVMRRSGLRMAVINAPPPNYTGGERGFAAVVGAEDRFKHDMRRVFRYAEALNTRVVHVMSGNGAGGESLDTFISNLKWASKSAPKGLILTIKPLNEVDFPEYFLNDFGLAAKVLDAVRKSNVRLQFDSYHAQMIEGDAVSVWKKYGLRAAHVQIADAPDRGAPGEGKVDFPALLAAMRETEYKGWVSAAYVPGKKQTEDTLRWMKKFSAAWDAS